MVAYVRVLERGGVKTNNYIFLKHRKNIQKFNKTKQNKTKQNPKQTYVALHHFGYSK